jgi:RimJ/RimL family protein N-acetyltransferase
MSAPPITRLIASESEIAQIREAVRNADVSALGEGAALAREDHAGALVRLLADEQVSGPIYDLPRPITEESVRAWIHEAETARALGEGLLVVRLDQDGEAFSYSRFTVWPTCASGEIAGAFRADMQSRGAGKVGAARSFAWMFEALHLRLVCVTAALDNYRSARVIEAAGFVYMGTRESIRPDGGRRTSHYWELTRESWLNGQKAAN